MPSQFLGLNIAYSGLLTSNAGLNTTSNNISNIETKGYSRQVNVQKARDAMRSFTSYGCVGTGVDVASIDRMRNEFYDLKYWLNNKNLGEYSVKSYYVLQIEDLFKDDPAKGFEGFTTIFSTVYDAYQEVQKNAGSVNTRSQLVGYLGNLATYFNGNAGNLENLQKDLNSEIKVKTDQINSYAAEISSLTKQINTIEVMGGKANALRDQRQLMIDYLSKIIDVNIKEVPVVDVNNPDRVTGAHRYIVTIGGGELLVDTNSFRTLQCVARPSYMKNYQTDVDGLYDVKWSDGSNFNIYAGGLGGELRGLIEMRDGNNGEQFKGKCSDVTTKTNASGVVITYAEIDISSGAEFLKNIDKYNLSDTGGQINIGDVLYYYDSWEYVHDAGAASAVPPGSLGPEYKVIFQLSPLKTDGGRNDIVPTAAGAVDKASSVGPKVDYQGIPYYMQQMNEWVRKYARATNETLFLHVPPAFDSYGNIGQNLLTGVTIQGNQFSFEDYYNRMWWEYEKAVNSNADPDLDTFLSNQTQTFEQFYHEKDANNAYVNAEAFAKFYYEIDPVTKVANKDKYIQFSSNGGNNYNSLTAKNFQVSLAVELDPSVLATHTGGLAVGQDGYNIIDELAHLARNKEKFSFRNHNGEDFLQCILSDIALNANKADTFLLNYDNISYAIDTQRKSISGVDQDEEAVSLIKYQNAYNLAAKMIQTMTEIYDRLILQTGV